jgi:hypothetical protein
MVMVQVSTVEVYPYLPVKHTLGQSTNNSLYSGVAEELYSATLDLQIFKKPNTAMNIFMNITIKLLLGLNMFTLAACTKPAGETPSNQDTDVAGLDKTTYTYTEEAFGNPERGWYQFNDFQFPYGGSGEAPLSEATVRGLVDRGVTIVHNIYHMYDFVDKPLSQEFLDTFEANMDAIRAGGAKCLLRFAYSASYDTANDRPIVNSDAPYDIFEGHIAQLKPLIQKHGDVLFVMEAGFIGAWGEWYYTSNYNFRPSTAADYEPRRKVLDKLLDAVPKDRMICVRYPAAKLMMYNLKIADSVTLATAFNESDISRIAMHNDCFVANASDMGTFGSREYWQKESRYLIMGGETCQRSTFSACENTLKQMENFHFTYLNNGYHQSVIGNWRSEGCYDEINLRLGYRLSLTETYFTEKPSIDKPLEIVMYINSNGFASPMNPRDVEIVFVEKGNTGNAVRIKTDVDPRYWFAGETHKVSLSLDISKLAGGKTYNVYLNLPDPKPALNTRPEYSIRLANTDVWDATTGYNKLREITVN